MSSVSLDEHTMSTLEPEERDAINGVGMSADDLAAMTAVAEGAGADDPDDDEGDPSAALVEGATAPKPEATAAVEAAAAAAPSAPAAEVVVAEPVAAAPVQHQAFVATLPDDYDAQVAAMKEAGATLRQRFKAGDLDVDEYAAETDLLAEQRQGLTALKIEADIASKMREQSERSQWESAINGLMASALREGVDYAKDEARRDDLDMFVKSLASNPAHADKTMDWFLSEGHKRVKTLYGDTVAAAPAAAAPAAAPVSRKPPLDALPATLAQVPGGDGPGDLAGEFAHIDRLSGDELEAAISRMSVADRERFQRGL